MIFSSPGGCCSICLHAGALGHTPGFTVRMTLCGEAAPAARPVTPETGPLGSIWDSGTTHVPFPESRGEAGQGPAASPNDPEPLVMPYLFPPIPSQVNPPFHLSQKLDLVNVAVASVFSLPLIVPSLDRKESASLYLQVGSWGHAFLGHQPSFSPSSSPSSCFSSSPTFSSSSPPPAGAGVSQLLVLVLWELTQGCPAIPCGPRPLTSPPMGTPLPRFPESQSQETG